MAKPITFGHIEVSLTTEMRASQGKPAPNDPFHILILGDFASRTKPGMQESGNILARRHPFAIDRDNFENVLADLLGELSLGSLDTDHPPLVIQLKELDDFHPDQIVERLDLFQRLIRLRTQLTNPSTFKTAAAEIRAQPPKSREKEAHPAIPNMEGTLSEKPTPVSRKQLLDQIIKGSEAKQTPLKDNQEAEDWNKFLEAIVAPHLLPKMDPDQPELLKQVDRAIGIEMKKLLHHPLVRKFEAAWRGLFFLVSNLHTDTKLKIFVLNVSKAELKQDLCSTEDLGNTAMFHHLVENTLGIPGGEPWAVIGGLYSFDQTEEDVQLLGRLAKIAGQAKAPFISAATSNIVGCPSFAQTSDPADWRMPNVSNTKQFFNVLRQQPEARYLGLALPRFILRLPYGKETIPLERFEFEEMSDPPNHEDYVWGNPIFACLYILGESYSRKGWSSCPGTFQEIEGLPLHIFNSEGESQVKPCAEVLLTERAIDVILEQGVMPLVSVKNRDTICLARIQSIADPLQPLAGRWNEER